MCSAPAERAHPRCLNKRVCSAPHHGEGLCCAVASRSSPPAMVYASAAPSGLPWHARRVTGWRPPKPAVILSSCTSGVHTGAWFGTACWEREKVVWHLWLLAPTHRGSPSGLAPAPARARPRRTGSSAALPGPGRCGCPSAAPSACSSCAAGSRGVPPGRSRLWGSASCWAPMGATGCSGGWGRGQALTSACVDGEGLRGASAPLQAVLEALRWVVTVGAGHAPHGAAKSCRLHHGEGGTVGACRCEFVDRCHRNEHGHVGCVAHGGSAILAPPRRPHWAGCDPPRQAGGCGNGGTTPGVGISSAAEEECFLCDLLVLGSGRTFSHPTRHPLGTRALTALRGLPSHRHHNGGRELEAHSGHSL